MQITGSPTAREPRSDGCRFTQTLEEVRVYWIQISADVWLFPGQETGKTYADTSYRKAIKVRKRWEAGIKKKCLPSRDATFLRDRSTSKRESTCCTISRVGSHKSFITDNDLFCTCRQEHCHQHTESAGLVTGQANCRSTKPSPENEGPQNTTKLASSKSFVLDAARSPTPDVRDRASVAGPKLSSVAALT